MKKLISFCLVLAMVLLFAPTTAAAFDATLPFHVKDGISASSFPDFDAAWGFFQAHQGSMLITEDHTISSQMTPSLLLGKCIIVFDGCTLTFTAAGSLAAEAGALNRIFTIGTGRVVLEAGSSLSDFLGDSGALFSLQNGEIHYQNGHEYIGGADVTDLSLNLVISLFNSFEDSLGNSNYPSVMKIDILGDATLNQNFTLGESHQQIVVGSGGSLTISNNTTLANNSGTVKIDAGGSIHIGADGTLSLGSTLRNGGTIEGAGRILMNYGSITNNGTLDTIITGIGSLDRRIGRYESNYQEIDFTNTFVYPRADEDERPPLWPFQPGMGSDGDYWPSYDPNAAPQLVANPADKNNPGMGGR